MSLVKKSLAAGDRDQSAMDEEAAKRAAQLLAESKRMNEMERQRNEEMWAERRKVLPGIPTKGSRRWAYNIRALGEAGLYDKDSYGYRIAMKCISETERPVEVEA